MTTSGTIAPHPETSKLTVCYRGPAGQPVKIETRQVEAFLRKPDPRIRGVVVYGNDDGLIA